MAPLELSQKYHIKLHLGLMLIMIITIKFETFLVKRMNCF